jgi:hypothetical protein
MQCNSDAKRYNAAVEHVKAAASPEELAEHKSALLSSLGCTVIYSDLQRKVKALLKTNWQPTKRG